MKQFAVRSLGLGVALMSLIQLPVLASSRVPSVSADASADLPLPTQTLSTEQPQLLAQFGITSRTLGPNSDERDVRALQRFLIRDGLYVLRDDGIYGQATADAVASYQARRRLPVTGFADEETLADMGFEFIPGAQSSFNSTIPQPPRRTASSGGISFGSTGTNVIRLQQRLNEVGIPVFVDGVYGPETERAVRNYQRRYGLRATGVADSETLRDMGFSSSFASSAESSLRYVAAVMAGDSQINAVRDIYEDAYVVRDRRGDYIFLGEYAERFPAEARADAFRARGFNTRVLYRRNGLF